MTRLSKEERRKLALYRFLTIASLLPPHLKPSERATRIQEILARPPQDPFGTDRSLSERTVYRWLRTFETTEGDRLAALEPRPRKDRGRSKTIPPELLEQAIRLREKAPRLSVKSILERIDHEAKDRVSVRSVARALFAAGYDRRDKRRRIVERVRGTPPQVPWDLEKWEADFPNDVWQLDSTPGIWLPAGRHRKEPVRLEIENIIDDHSRRVVGGGFTERLRLTDLLGFLVPAIKEFGCPSSLYGDQGGVHNSVILRDGIASLGGVLILGTAGHAPGRGKVERLHQIQLETLLEDLRLSPVETVEEANRYYSLWRERYDAETHGETGESPRSRWERILGNARIPGEDELRWAFRGRIERTIDKVGGIDMLGEVYEAPSSQREGAPRRVSVRYDLLDRSTIWIEDEAGLRHACPIYRTRSHTERRRRRPEPEGGVSFADLFNPGPE